MTSTFKKPSLFQKKLIGEKEPKGLNLPERSVPIDDYQYRRDQVIPNSGRGYNPDEYNKSGKEIFWDVAQSIPSGLTRVAESLPGLPGDLSDMKYDLARWINSKTGGSMRYPGIGKTIDTMQKYDPGAWLPNTEEVAEKATDPLLEATGTKDFFRYQPQTPFGGATQAGLEFGLDPVNAVAPGVGKLAKARRFFKR